MQITKLYTGKDGHTYFEDVEIGVETQRELGAYSKNFPVENMLFRTFGAGLIFDWHNAPQEQYIIYLSGEVEVETSASDKRVFKSGDVLLAADLEGKGHVTRTLIAGKSAIITRR